jgi:hypothetical protein
MLTEETIERSEMNPAVPIVKGPEPRSGLGPFLIMLTAG